MVANIYGKTIDIMSVVLIKRGSTGGNDDEKLQACSGSNNVKVALTHRIISGKLQ